VPRYALSGNFPSLCAKRAPSARRLASLIAIARGDLKIATIAYDYRPIIIAHASRDPRAPPTGLIDNVAALVIDMNPDLAAWSARRIQALLCEFKMCPALLHLAIVDLLAWKAGKLAK